MNNVLVLNTLLHEKAKMNRCALNILNSIAAPTAVAFMKQKPTTYCGKNYTKAPNAASIAHAMHAK